MKKFLLGSLIAIFILIHCEPSYAQKSFTNETNDVISNDSLMKKYDFPQIDIIGRKPSLLQKIPGSANVISFTSLINTQPASGNEVFKKVSGINVVDEEGAGLRANIGIRGLDPDRSRTILMMEDGIPIALAPYGEPEMYYTPSVDRMQYIEILKGSGSILFGPQTIGGVINYITADPPIESRTSIRLKGGENGFFTGSAAYGTTIDNVGLQVGYLHRRANKLGLLNFTTNDFTAKIRFNSGENSRIGLKFAVYDEISNSTYVGLTQPMYDRGEYYTEIAPYDKLDIKRYSASLTHDYFISDKSYLRTTFFAYTTTRNWLRQDFSRAPASNMTGVVFGDTSISGGAIFMRNTTGNRDRQFEVAGVEPRFFYSFTTGNIKNEFEGGIRFLYEKAYEQRINGTKANALSGTLAEDETRTGYALSLFLQDRILLNESITVTPGVRVESFKYERDIFRISSRDTSLIANDDVLSVVPGIGINYNAGEVVTLFGGVHRGFAPPRIKDAISNSGTSLQLEAELSWNYEIGTRLNFNNIFLVELTGYMLDFSNQVIPVSESSGGAGTGLVNGGRTNHKGMEAGFTFDLGKLLKSEYGLQLGTSATYSQSEYNADRFVTRDNVTTNINGNKLPYAPEYSLSALIDILTPVGFGIQFSGTYVTEQFTDELNTVQAAANGETGLMPSYFVLDATGRYMLNSLNSTIYVSVKNLLDERYIASRRPQGIKVGLPRLITAGFEITL